MRRMVYAFVVADSGSAKPADREQEYGIRTGVESDKALRRKALQGTVPYTDGPFVWDPIAGNPGGAPGAAATARTSRHRALRGGAA